MTPKPVVKVVINAALMIKLGNGYGLQWVTHEESDKILGSINIEQLKYYLNSELHVLEDISCKILPWNSRIEMCIRTAKFRS